MATEQWDAQSNRQTAGRAQSRTDYDRDPSPLKTKRRRRRVLLYVIAPIALNYLMVLVIVCTLPNLSSRSVAPADHSHEIVVDAHDDSHGLPLTTVIEVRAFGFASDYLIFTNGSDSAAVATTRVGWPFKSTQGRRVRIDGTTHHDCLIAVPDAMRGFLKHDTVPLAPNWLLALNMVVYVALFHLLVTVPAAFYKRSMSIGRLCMQCHYDLSGGAGDRCPECGRRQETVSPPSSRVVRRLIGLRVFRSKVAMRLILTLLVSCAFVFVGVLVGDFNLHSDARRKPGGRRPAGIAAQPQEPPAVDAVDARSTFELANRIIDANRLQSMKVDELRELLGEVARVRMNSTYDPKQGAILRENFRTILGRLQQLRAHDQDPP